LMGESWARHKKRPLIAAKSLGYVTRSIPRQRRSRFAVLRDAFARAGVPASATDGKFQIQCAQHLLGAIELNARLVLFQLINEIQADAGDISQLLLSQAALFALFADEFADLHLDPPFRPWSFVRRLYHESSLDLFAASP